jgi:hypothetical protein
MTTYEITFNEKTKIGKNFLVFLQENKKFFKLKKTSKMTQEEFYAKIDKSIEQDRRGESFEVKPEDFKKFLGLE